MHMQPFRVVGRHGLGRQQCARQLSHRVQVATLQKAASQAQEPMTVPTLPVAIGLVGPGGIGSAFISQLVAQVTHMRN